MAPTNTSAISIFWSMRLPGTTLVDLGGLRDEPETLLGVHVDALTPTDLPTSFRAKLLAKARPI